MATGFPPLVPSEQPTQGWSGSVADGGSSTPHSDPVLLDPIVVRVDDQVVPWAGTNFTVTWPVNELPSATLDITLKDGWGVNVGTEAEPVIKTLDEVLSDRQRVMIHTARPEPETNYALFEGCLAARHFTAREDGRHATLHLVHLADILDTETFVQGQFLKGMPGVDLPFLHVPARDCVFNPRGAKNCRKDMIPWGSLQMPLFTHRMDTERRSWNWARVLLYLLGAARYVPGSYEPAPKWTRFEFALGKDQDNQTIVDRIINDGHAAAVPDDAGDPGDPWARVLRGKPNGHSIEGLSWWKALIWTCARCGLGFCWDPVPDAQGVVTWSLRFFVPEPPPAGSPCVLLLPSTAMRTDNKSWTEVRQQANVEMLDLEQDWRSGRNVATLLGAPRRYEITTELVPGWASNAEWDVAPDNAAQIATLIAQMEGGTQWAERYVLGGPLSIDPQYALAGRLWGLNTYGAWNGHGRAWAPWTAARYDLFDFEDVRMADGAVPRTNVPVARTFEPCLSEMAPGVPYPVLVELSFDSGTTWQPATEVTVSRRDLRIMLTSQDLRLITRRPTAQNPAETSLPKAYIRGWLRVRVTASLDHDQRVTWDRVTLASSSLMAERTMLVCRDQDWKLQKRDGEFGNSQYNRTLYPYAPDRTSEVRDDSQVMLADAARLLNLADRVRTRGTVVLPELTFPYLQDGLPVTGYRPGQFVEQVKAHTPATGEPAVPEYQSLPLDSAADGVGTLIAAVVWNYAIGPDERCAFATTLQLEDVARLANLQGGG